jgi:hypothetical protein
VSPLPLPEDGRRTSFRNVMMFILYFNISSGRCTKFRRQFSIILICRQNERNEIERRQKMNGKEKKESETGVQKEVKNGTFKKEEYNTETRQVRTKTARTRLKDGPNTAAH